MGCAASINSSDTDTEPLNAAEELLQKAKEEERFRLKVLLLGAGESGKSTVVKQIKIIWNVQESEHEKVRYILALRKNVLEAIQILLQAGITLSQPVEDEELQSIAKEIMEMDDSAKFTPSLAIKVDRLWHDTGVQKVFARRNEFWNMDATPYYLDEVHRIASQDFEPTEEDMIMARVRTTGIVVSEINDKPYTFQVVDVGGQRSERRKWIHCFDDVKAIIYLASLSGYSQVLFEDNSQNIMHESLALFEEVVKNPIFKDIPIFVFLNKKDLFEANIRVHPLSSCFPEYDGPEGEMGPAISFIEKQFQRVVEKYTPQKNVHIHVIAARVRMDMKMAFGEVKDNLKKMNPPRKATMISPATRATAKRNDDEGRTIRR